MFNFYFICILLIGSFFRFYNLTDKPLWTDEFATLVFSLGNSYQSVPLNQLISINELLKPLEYQSDANFLDVVNLLINQDNHPPLYFIFSHFWFYLFNTNSQYISIFVARSLSAILGILSIILTYLLSKFTFKSSSLTLYITWLTAISPFGIYLAQEARHYTLAIIAIIISFFGLLTLINNLLKSVKLSWLLTIGLIIANLMGIVTHYFFIIFLWAEFLTIMWLWLKDKLISFNQIRLWLVKEFCLLIFCLYWFTQIIPSDYGTNMTSWIETDTHNLLSIISPFFQLLATIITMIFLLPVEANNLGLIIISVLVMLGVFIYLIPLVMQGFKHKRIRFDLQITKRICLYFLTSSLLTFLGITYILGLDITRGARYSFVYFPILIIFLSLCFSQLNFSSRKKQTTKRAKLIIVIIGVLSGITVTCNLGYQKYYRPDLLLSVIQQNSSEKIVIATTHKTLVQTGEMMGIGYLIFQQPKFNSLLTNSNFLLTHYLQDNQEKAQEILRNNLHNIIEPFDLWLVNFYAPLNLPQCKSDRHNNSFSAIDGYNYKLYHCDFHSPKIDKIIN